MGVDRAAQVLAFPKHTPWVSKEYRAFIRAKGCVICGGEAAFHHEQEKGHGGKGTKADDTRGVGLCWRCHHDRHQYGRSFWKRWRIDVEQIISRNVADYRAQGGKIKEG